MDIYKLYRDFWDFCFENPDKIKPNHIAIFSFAIEHCNRLGWKKRFGLPTSMVLEAIGVKSYSVYKKAFDELVEFGFIEVIEYSKNQYSSNIIALKESSKALDKALDKALIKHTTKQRESTGESISSIDKQVTSNKEPLTISLEKTFIPILEAEGEYKPETNYDLLYINLTQQSQGNDTVLMQNKITQQKLESFAKRFIEKLKSMEQFRNVNLERSYFLNWIKGELKISAESATGTNYRKL